MSALVDQVLVTGLYASTVAYSLPLGAAATPSESRAVGMSAFAAHVSPAGSYASTVPSLPVVVDPPMAYSLPPATPKPRRSRAVGMSAFAAHVSPAGSY